MSFPDFLSALFETGTVSVPALDGPEGFGDAPEVLAMIPPGEVDDARGLLAEYERVVRRDWPLSPPPAELGTAVHAAGYVYSAARLVISRHVPGQIVEHLLSGTIAPDAGPASHYAVDLTGRFLPDLVRLAGGDTSDDPLVAQLRAFAHDWPLSSVGVPHVEPSPERLAGIVETPALLFAYTDRVLRLGDAGRLKHPAVADRGRAAVGPHHNLLPPALHDTLRAEPATP